MKFDGQTELQSVEFFKREYGEYTTNDAVNQIFYFPACNGNKEQVHIIYKDGTEKIIYDFDEIVAK
jgi:hypothetical protein